MEFSPSFGSFGPTPLIQTMGSLEATEQQLASLEKQAFEEGQHLSKDKQDLYKAMVRQGIGQIRNQLANMRAQGKTEYAISRAVEILVLDFKTSNSSFIEKNQLCNSAKEEVNSNFHHTNIKLSNLSSNFGKIKRIQFDDEEEKTSQFMESLQKSDNLKDLMSKSEENEKSLKYFIESKAEQKALKEATKIIKTKYGKTASIAFKTGAKTALHSPDEESENPNRDLVISSASSVGVGEVLAFGLKQIPIAKVITVPLALHDLTIIGQESVSKIAQNQEMRDCWNENAFLNDNPRFETSCAIAQGVLKVCQIPGDCLEVVTNYVSEKIAATADDFGITEKNMLSSLEIMGNYNHYEDTYWKS